MSNIEFFDTHCHIHDPEFASNYDQTIEEIIADAKSVGVSTLICVGTDLASSLSAISFAIGRDSCYCSLAIHPHEVAAHPLERLIAELDNLEMLIKENKSKIVAIGECGLDYYYHVDEKTRAGQKTLLIKHLDIATKHNLPVIFHIRNPKDTPEDSLGKAFADFFEIIDKYKKITGVVHSFSAGLEELNGVLERGLYVGLNGIMTFTKQRSQLQAAKMVPSSKMVLETDAPFLTPAPFRGTMCKPKHLRQTAEFLSDLRGESLEELAKYTTENAKALFGI
jgi:TatD DNase family protein